MMSSPCKNWVYVNVRHKTYHMFNRGSVTKNDALVQIRFSYKALIHTVSRISDNWIHFFQGLVATSVPKENSKQIDKVPHAAPHKQV